MSLTSTKGISTCLDRADTSLPYCLSHLGVLGLKTFWKCSVNVSHNQHHHVFSLSNFSILFDTWWWFCGLAWESSAGTVGDGNDCCGDGDKYLSPCSSLVEIGWRRTYRHRHLIDAQQRCSARLNTGVAVRSCFWSSDWQKAVGPIETR